MLAKGLIPGRGEPFLAPAAAPRSARNRIKKEVGTMSSHREEVDKWNKEGLNQTEIARRLGISKERVRQILKGKPVPSKETLDSKIMLTTGDVAHLLGLSVNTVRRWNKLGILKAYHLGPRGDRRFRREDVDSFLADIQCL